MVATATVAAAVPAAASFPLLANSVLLPLLAIPANEIMMISCFVADNNDLKVSTNNSKLYLDKNAF